MTLKRFLFIALHAKDVSLLAFMLYLIPLYITAGQGELLPEPTGAIGCQRIDANFLKIFRSGNIINGPHMYFHMGLAEFPDKLLFTQRDHIAAETIGLDLPQD